MCTKHRSHPWHDFGRGGPVLLWLHTCQAEDHMQHILSHSCCCLLVLCVTNMGHKCVLFPFNHALQRWCILRQCFLIWDVGSG